MVKIAAKTSGVNQKTLQSGQSLLILNPTIKPKSMNIDQFIKGIPKAELHVHIEGTFEPELMFAIANRNNIKLKHASVSALSDAYQFNNLQEFLDIYYTGANVLIKEEDFYDLTIAYLKKAHAQNILHTEIFFDPQTHTSRGIKFSTVINGISKALKDGNTQFGISTRLIMCFLRHLDEASAMETLEQSLPYKELITAVGLDSSEAGNPPSKFKRVFEKAQKEGFLTVAHAGEEGPPEYIREAIDLLNVSRIDHGNRCLEDEALVKELAEKQIPLTLCPLSNLSLKVIRDLHQYPLREMEKKGLLVTINSDDPPYFGGYLNDNYSQITSALNLSKEDIERLAKNSFKASFLDDERKNFLIKKVEEFSEKQ